jgi:hypothetical protein
MIGGSDAKNFRVFHNPERSVSKNVDIFNFPNNYFFLYQTFNVIMVKLIGVY